MSCIYSMFKDIDALHDMGRSAPRCKRERLE